MGEEIGVCIDADGAGRVVQHGKGLLALVMDFCVRDDDVFCLICLVVEGDEDVGDVVFQDNGGNGYAIGLRNVMADVAELRVVRAVCVLQMQGRRAEKAAARGGVRLCAAAIAPLCVGSVCELLCVDFCPVVQLVHDTVVAHGQHQAGVCRAYAYGLWYDGRHLHRLVRELLLFLPCICGKYGQQHRRQQQDCPFHWLMWFGS